MNENNKEPIEKDEKDSFIEKNETLVDVNNSENKELKEEKKQEDKKEVKKEEKKEGKKKENKTEKEEYKKVEKEKGKKIEKKEGEKKEDDKIEDKKEKKERNENKNEIKYENTDEIKNEEKEKSTAKKKEKNKINKINDEEKENNDDGDKNAEKNNKKELKNNTQKNQDKPNIGKERENGMKKGNNDDKTNLLDTNDISENNYDIGDMNYDFIDNNFTENIGIEQITDESKGDKVFIKKNLLRSINSFLACLGPPGAGKSTFCSNYYKMLYKVKNNYFEASEGILSFTKGIWVVSEAERRKIPVVIKRDLLDVEGFRVNEAKSWRYVMIIAFLSTDLLILNRNARFDDIKMVLNIVGNSLDRMKKQKLPRILKKIYIQMSNSKLIKKYKVEEFLEQLGYTKSHFEGIKFEYMYLPFINSEYENVLDDPQYQKYFNDILKLLNKTKQYNSVTSLINYIDDFNQTINGNAGFNSQTILKDIEFDFNGVYSRYENKLKNELTKKINDLKPLEDLNESFEDFINKQEDLQLTFEIKNEELTFYGGCDDFNNFYEDLKKKKTF